MQPLSAELLIVAYVARLTSGLISYGCRLNGSGGVQLSAAGWRNWQRISSISQLQQQLAS